MMKKVEKKADYKLPKKRLQKILVPLDGSKFSIHSLNYAINLAKFTNSRIVGIFVVPSDDTPAPIDDLLNPLSSISTQGYETKTIKQGQKILESAEKRCKQNKTTFSKKILFGNPGNQIVKYAEDKKTGIELIIMGSHGHGHAGEILLGSVSYKVVHKSKKPVMIIK
ncbi:MAG: universal stress protein [Nitrosopumilus sp.]|nr:universal stress protein [Nitrosopumilus sp.]